MKISTKQKLSKSLTDFNNIQYYGYSQWKKKYNCWIIRVGIDEYPELKDYDGNKGRCYKYNNKRHKYVNRSYKNWIDAGNKMPPKNYVLYHLDGNSQNDNVDNLYPIPRTLLGPLNQKFKRTQSRELNLLSIRAIQLQQKLLDFDGEFNTLERAREYRREYYLLHKEELKRKMKERYLKRKELKLKG